MSGYRAVAVCLVAAISCTNEAIQPENLPGLILDGVVETTLGSPIVGATVVVAVWDSTFNSALVNVTLMTDANGRFGGHFDMDTILVYGTLQAEITPSFGSGLSTGFIFSRLTFNSAGQADTSGIRVALPQLEPPVPEGPALSLTAALLEGGDYYGQTVPPRSNTGEAYLDLVGLTATGDSVHGRYDIDFSASTACGDGNGDVSGRVINDTLYLRLVSDSFPGWDGVVKVNHFIANIYTPSADTLILRYPASSGPCSWGSPAPLRLVR